MRRKVRADVRVSIMRRRCCTADLSAIEMSKMQMRISASTFRTLPRRLKTLIV